MPPRQPFVERDYYSDPRRRVRSAIVRLLRGPARRAGFDFELRSFYSPIPDLDAIDERIWSSRSELPGIPFDLDRQLAFLRGELAGFIAEFNPPRRAGDAGAARTDATAARTDAGAARTDAGGEYYLDNGLFGPGDAELLYAMVRAHRSRRVLEVGAGFSTLVSAAAVRANREHGHGTVLISCDPYASRERAAHLDGLAELRPIAAEHLGAAEFAALRAGDILFIDSSHTVRLGGDVVHLLCEVVPRLAAGVLVHLHDIYLPYHYPREWYERFGWYWAEQYLLQALLCGNARLEPVLAAYALWRERRAELLAVIPSLASGPPPLSFWLRVGA